MFTKWRKTRMRREALARRRRAYDGNPDAGRKLAENFPDALWPAVHSIVAGYRPVRDEIDPTPLMETFFCDQARLCLPVVVDADSPLKFKTWSPGDGLEPGPFGIEQPAYEARIATPSLLLVPLVAFDRKGRRLGYGGGYYDRTISYLRSRGPLTVVGLAYEAQKFSSLPRERHDERLDWVVTETKAYQPKP